MELRERKFVDYAQAARKFKRTPSSIPTSNRKRTVSEKNENELSETGGRHKYIPRLKRRATASEESSSTNSESTQSTSCNRSRARTKQPQQIKQSSNSSQSDSGNRRKVKEVKELKRSSQNTSNVQSKNNTVEKPQSSKRSRSRKSNLQELSTLTEEDAAGGVPHPSNKAKSRRRVSGKPILSNEKQPTKQTKAKNNRNNKKRRRTDFEEDECEGEEEDEFSNNDEESQSDVTSDEDEYSSIYKKKNKQKSEEHSHIDDCLNSRMFNRRYRELIPSNVSNPPRQFYEMQGIWLEMSSRMTDEMLSNYKKTLLRLMNGRLSCLNSIRKLMPNFPVDLVEKHERLYNLLCEASGAYPFKYHKGSRLISKHNLADTSQLGAQLIIECLDRNVLPFDILNETTVLTQIETYVRIGIKDMLEEIVGQLPSNRNTITVADLKESLSSRLLD